MHALWDVFLEDAVSLAWFAATVVSAAGFVSLFRAYRGKCLSWRTIARGTLRGAGCGFLVAIALGVLLDHLASIMIGAIVAASFTSSFTADRQIVTNPSRATPRFTLRQLLLAQLVIAVLIGWWLITRQERIEQQRLTLDWQRRKAEAESVFGPYWFNVGVSRTDDSIHLRRPRNVVRPGWNDNQPVNDETLRLIASHPNITFLDAASNAITDQGLSHIAKATQLKVIDIKSSQITNAGVESLCALPNIETIHIDSPNITPAVLQHVAKVKSLKVFVIGNSKFQDGDGTDFRNSRPDVNLSIWQWSAPQFPPPVSPASR